MNSKRLTSSTPANRMRRGQALVEFSIIAFVFTFLLAAMLALGFLFFSANVLQQAADVGAMELARHPASPTAEFDSALNDSGLYDPAFLVCLIDGPNKMAEDLPANYTPDDVQALQDRMPLINRMLFSLYIFDPDWNALRFPGASALYDDPATSETELIETVIIPIVGSRDPTTGVESIVEWRRVVEEIAPSGQTEGPYSVLSMTTGNLDPGMVALRINYPYQSAAMVAHIQVSGTTVLTIQEALTSDVDEFTNVPVQVGMASNAGTLPTGYTLETVGVNPDFEASAHRGQYGMGELNAYATTVRPYRKVISAQGIYRREVFE